MTLTQINLCRTYKKAEETHRRLTKSGYYSIAHTVADFMCDIEDTWIAEGLNIGDLIYPDFYEQIANEVNELPQTTYNDFITYLNSFDGGIF